MWLQRARYPTISHKSKSRAQKRLLVVKRRPKKEKTSTRMMSRSKEPEVAVEVEPESHFDIAAQVVPPQPSAREELVATLHSLTPDMLISDEFLTGWTNVVEGRTSTPSIMITVTPLTVMAWVMQQLVRTPEFQLTTIPVTIPLTSTAATVPVTLQSQLWVEGHKQEQEDHERVVEVKRNKEETEGS